MKISKVYTLVVLMLVMVSSCGKDDPSTPDERDLAFEKLSGSWTLGSTGEVIVDGQDVSLNYSGFSLSFTDGAYTTINAGELFNASGNWSWANEQAGEITLNGNRSIRLMSLSDSQFTFSFTFSGNGGVRAGVSGGYEITVVK